MKKQWCLLWFIFAGVFTGLSSHPHVYIDMSLSLYLSDEGLKGVRQEWTFLHSFGDTLIKMFDIDGNGTFDSAETGTMEKVLFGKMEYCHYFTFLTRGEQIYVPEYISGFSADCRGGQMSISFYVPLNLVLKEWTEDFSLKIYDPSSYVSFGLQYVDEGYGAHMKSEIYIGRDDGVYSHGCLFGSAVIYCTLTSSEKDFTAAKAESAITSLAVFNPADNTRGFSVNNPFLPDGLGLVHDNLNPFVSTP